MGKLVPIVVVALAVVVFFLYSKLSDSREKFDFPKHGYFGSGTEKPDDKTIHPFKIEVPEAVLTDLKNRLTNARLGHEQLEDVSDFEYGFNLKTLEVYRDYWLNKYDWKKQEKLLNTFSHFKTQIEGLNIHFIHAKPPANKYKKVVPLLIVHGWPGNVFEFHKIIPMLTDPNANLNGVQSDVAFEVVAPSIPGYGWSEQAKKSGFNQVATARIFNKLMVDRLKFKKYLVQGGDWGSLVVTNVGRMYPENLYGVHVNMMFMFPGRDFKSTAMMILGSIAPSWVFSSPEFASFNMKRSFVEFIKESGYMHIQATKPDTVGVGLNDSPIGLLAYILEKFSGWTNPLFKSLDDGGLERKFTKDELITIIMIYWLNGNIVSSQRYYKEYFGSPEAMKFAEQYVSAPVGYAHFPHDLGGDAGMPPEIVSVAYNLTHYYRHKDGGHFAAFEVPQYLAKDFITFAKKVVP